MTLGRLVFCAASIGIGGCAPESVPPPPQAQSEPQRQEEEMPKKKEPAPAIETATFGAGCFWCVEAVMQRLEGVRSVTSGYSGGAKPDPTYQEVCTGETGHAEAVQVTFDASKISYEALLEVFFKTHDPTTLNRQGGDEGTQYRSAIFHHNDRQRQVAEQIKKELDAAKIWRSPIVTEIVPFEKFYAAEGYHQDYYNRNPGKGYCVAVIGPKLEKFKKVFKDRLKKGAE